MMRAATNATPHGVPTWRLHVLRAMYLLIVVGLGCVIWPNFFNRTHPWVLMDSVVSCMLVAFSLLALVGLRHPLRMLPILLWELTWKTAWLAVIAAPLALQGRMDPATMGTVVDCSPVVLVALVIPWRYVLHHYFRARGERWSST